MSETLSLEDYRRVALETASYESIDGISFLYPAVGIIGELGEVSDVIKKLWRDSGGVLDHSWRYKLVMELGDALWFVVALEREFGVQASWCSEPDGKHTNPLLTVLQINQVAGHLSGCVREICLGAPDSRNMLKQKHTNEIGSCLNIIFYCLTKLALFIEVPLEEIFAANIQKLQYRRAGGQQKYR